MAFKSAIKFCNFKISPIYLNKNNVGRISVGRFQILQEKYMYRKFKTLQSTNNLEYIINSQL